MAEKQTTSTTTNGFADKDGQFRRQPSKFRNTIEPAADVPFPAVKDRYVLYINYGCPWAHRTNITRCLKGLQDIIQLVEVDARKPDLGWFFSGRTGPDSDPLYGGKYLRDLYERAEPGYEGRTLVPTLWDKEKETIVSNESSEIIRMFYTAFDHLLPEDKREEAKGKAGLFPEHLRNDIEAMNEWVYDTVNNGVYKTGFASTQEAYEQNVFPLFKSLDRLEEHLSKPEHQPYLFGEHITEADIRLYPTIVRFDVGYYTLFKCNLKMIRHDYPKLHDWVRRLYWDESERTNGGAFGKTTRFDAIKRGYASATGSKVVPAGPLPDMLPLE
ncbi:hypothetical protein W97_04686 [Coniosporium apollinis CBS 100218]|uniref:GST C-terminal domain-containing protein n=1 Tax=Coniosporium apollinis (strain CBS 100218) TaxID=1168221 RepID=R7YUB8_CONA1|nr:uncharacterized protein W97_04686 [Coniosporium apollinis CBS 100218]EON65448.1 hypothetical protein W97_04686 [Coniosporium apollinis CBS 100218]